MTHAHSTTNRFEHCPSHQRTPLCNATSQHTTHPHNKHTPTHNTCDSLRDPAVPRRRAHLRRIWSAVDSESTSKGRSVRSWSARGGRDETEGEAVTTDGACDERMDDTRFDAAGDGGDPAVIDSGLAKADSRETARSLDTSPWAQWRLMGFVLFGYDDDDKQCAHTYTHSAIEMWM